MNNKVVYSILFGVGGILIGFFANKLDTIIGSCVFALGIVLLVFSIMNLSK